MLRISLLCVLIVSFCCVTLAADNIFSMCPNPIRIQSVNDIAEPSSRQDDSLWYGTLVYYNAIGLTNGGTFEWAIRLSPTELAPYAGWEIVGIKFYKYSGNLNNVVKVYDSGTQTNPGPMITSEPYTSSAPDEWVTVMLSSPVPIPGTGDLWCSVEGTHNAGEYPAACDAGPAVDFKGDWLYLNGSWSEAQSYGFDYNWMIIAYVEQAGGIEEENPSKGPAYSVTTFPNPMVSVGTISYSVPIRTDVEINIYDISGRFISQIVHGEVDAGSHSARWDRKDAHGVEVPQGVYLYEFNTALFNETGKIIVIR